MYNRTPNTSSEFRSLVANRISCLESSSSRAKHVAFQYSTQRIFSEEAFLSTWKDIQIDGAVCPETPEEMSKVFCDGTRTTGFLTRCLCSLRVADGRDNRLCRGDNLPDVLDTREESREYPSTIFIHPNNKKELRKRNLSYERGNKSN